MKGGITTNLLGRRVKITIGLNDEELAREIESMRRRTASVWRGDARAHIGEFGEVSAVFKDGEHCLQFTLALEGGNFATVQAQHCRLIQDERAARVPANWVPPGHHVREDADGERFVKNNAAKPEAELPECEACAGTGRGDTFQKECEICGGTGGLCEGQEQGQ